MNALLGERRMLTGPEAGITRDAIEVEWSWKGQTIRLVDTAGLRRRARVTAKLEKLSGADTLRSIRFAHVVVLVLDATEPFERQDLAIARLALEEGRALVIAGNKWDAVADRAAWLTDLRERLEDSLPQAKGVAYVTIAAEHGRNLDRLLDAVLTTYDTWNRRVSTSQLNRWLGAVTAAHPPPLVEGRRIRLRYATQVKTRPPTFAARCLCPLPGQWIAPGFQAYRGAHPVYAAQGEKPLRGQGVAWIVRSRRRTGGEQQARLADLARLYDRLIAAQQRRYYRRWEVDTSMFKKRQNDVVQDDVRLQRIKDRASGIRFALGFEEITIRQRREMEQTLRNLELAILGMERSLAGKD
jgi:small GTP-binding protein